MKTKQIAAICAIMALVACSASACSMKSLAKGGDARAQYELGRCYSEQRNYRCALDWLRKAAEQGHAGAQNRLGVMYERGEGVPIDTVEAYKWYTLAASAGSSYATANGRLLERRLTAEQIAAAQARLPRSPALAQRMGD